jgi:DNA polymerase III alpha subunit
MIPLFKSHYSIGRSILTLEEVNEHTQNRSVFALAQEAGLKELVLVEDSLIGFLEARKRATEYNLDLRFGLRVSVSNAPESEKACNHKVVVFAKNSEGCKLLNKIYTNAFAYGDGVLKEEYLRSIWTEDHLKLAVPFYDSFIFNNAMTFATCTPDLSFGDPTFFVEDNGLPFDSLINDEVDSYCDRNCYDIIETKSIFYKKREDFAAYQTYKCICNRTFKTRDLNVPNFDHQGSDLFCLEELT